MVYQECVKDQLDNFKWNNIWNQSTIHRTYHDSSKSAIMPIGFCKSNLEENVRRMHNQIDKGRNVCSKNQKEHEQLGGKKWTQ